MRGQHQRGLPIPILRVDVYAGGERLPESLDVPARRRAFPSLVRVERPPARLTDTRSLSRPASYRGTADATLALDTSRYLYTLLPIRRVRSLVKEFACAARSSGASVLRSALARSARSRGLRREDAARR
jgi:hypothetical protein